MAYYKDLAEFKSATGHDHGNNWYPRVTKIVDIKSKPALYQFYSAVGFHNGEKIKEQSATEGTLVHEIAEDIMMGGNPIIPELIKPSIDALNRFLEQTKITAYPDLMERRIIHPEFRYAGTVDAVAEINGRLGILDIKTSKAIYRDYNLQTAAYFDALKEELPDLTTRWILRIDQVETCFTCGATRRHKGGRIKISKPFPYTNGMCGKEDHDWSAMRGMVELKEIADSQNNDFAAFLGAKRLWEWENEYWLKRLGYL